ncbi:N-acetylmuramoyl-L-alanine amidase, partial [Fibrobacterota bacterium]
MTIYLPHPVDTVETKYSESEQKISLLIRKPLKSPIPEKKQVSEKKTVISAKTIIIDPGHGGRDPGAIYKSLKEKDIALSVAKKLKTLLRKKGFKVMLTREKDAYLPLKDRPKFASNHGGHLF